MEKSKVYFTDLRTKPGMNLLNKMEALVKKAGIEELDFDNKFTAIKIHFGEPGNLAFIRPNYAAKMASLVKAKGGKPFLTDASTLYSGRRSNALDHLQAAMENGYNYMTLGCHVLIADGLKGADFEEIEIDQEYCKTAKIGKALSEADVIISMNHFKGHEMTGFGGALKNLGMGCGSKAGKLEMHSVSKPKIKKKRCVGCGMCIPACSQKAIAFDADKKAEIDYEKCVGCGQCVAVCQFNAAQVVWDEAADITNRKIAEYTYAVLKGKPNFHISFIMNVSPNCDCWESNDTAIVPDLGIAASFDPVALDKACVDMVNEAAALRGSVLEDTEYNEGKDKFCHIHSNTDWKAGLEHAEKIGLGRMDYELILL